MKLSPKCVWIPISQCLLKQLKFSDSDCCHEMLKHTLERIEEKETFWWDLKQHFWMSLMIKNMITLSFSFWHYQNFSGFFYTKVKRDLTEPWKVSHAIQWYFCTCPFKLLPSFIPVWRREAHLQQVPCVREEPVCSPQPHEGSVDSGLALWLLPGEFLQYKSFHSSPKKSLTKAHSCLIFYCCCQ